MSTAYSVLAGAGVDTASEAWRHECECRWLLANKITKAEKHQYLFGVPDRAQIVTAGKLRPDASSVWPKDRKPVAHFRGLAAADRLLDDARKIFLHLKKSA